jgi:hypothetical protein
MASTQKERKKERKKERTKERKKETNKQTNKEKEMKTRFCFRASNIPLKCLEFIYCVR